MGFGLGLLAYGLTLGLLSFLIARVVGVSVSDWPWLIRTPLRILAFGIPIGTAWLFWRHGAVQTCDNWSTRSDEEVIAAAEASERRAQVRTIVAVVVLVGLAVLAGPRLARMWNLPGAVPPMPIQLVHRDALLDDSKVIVIQNTGVLPLSITLEHMRGDEVINSGRLTVGAGSNFEVGHLEGFQFRVGDVVRLGADGFATSRWNLK
jgi:hypothetical protein